VALRLADGSDELMSGFAHSGPAKGSVTHAHLSSEPFVTVAAAFAAGVFLFGLPSPAKATDQNGTAVLNSHLPRPAPIDHRQPTAAEAPQGELLSNWERQQQVLDVEVNRKLITCRGC
jgi:hypothetical protein